jgi:hypothetical protein
MTHSSAIVGTSYVADTAEVDRDISNRRQTPEEIMAELEERVGPEGRKMAASHGLAGGRKLCHCEGPWD